MTRSWESEQKAKLARVWEMKLIKRQFEDDAAKEDNKGGGKGEDRLKELEGNERSEKSRVNGGRESSLPLSLRRHTLPQTALPQRRSPCKRGREGGDRKRER